MPDQPRPVWLTREQRDDLQRCFDLMLADNRLPVLNVIRAWDAAPADATETAAKSIDAMLFARDGGSFTGLDCAETALRALGRPA